MTGHLETTVATPGPLGVKAVDRLVPDVLLVRGSAAGTTLTGTLYEPGERPPRFRGAPEEDAPFVWVCDEFYEVESGGALQRLNGREVRVAFETPMPRGFETREQALAAAREHLRTQFARIGVDEAAVEVDVVETDGTAE